MKKAVFSYFLLSLLFLVLITSALAEDITTGNQSAETRVTNNVNGGNVTTHIETTANGKTTVIDSNEPGEINVKNENGKVTVSKSPNVSITVKQNETSTNSPTITPKPEQKNFISGFFENIKSLFKRIFLNL